MVRVLRTSLLVPLLVIGLLVPKLSALALHLSPNILSIVICTGSELVTIHIGVDGQPVEATDTAQSDCVLADPGTTAAPHYAVWTQAPRSYSVAFSQTPNLFPSASERGLLPDLRGPPILS